MPPDHLEVEIIRAHYDRVSPYYQALWGEHIHHSQMVTGARASVQPVIIDGEFRSALSSALMCLSSGR
jgi:hypothetical protein